MEQNFMQDISIEEYAFYTGRSLSSFKRDFAEVCELTPQKWLIQRRLEKANDMIKEVVNKINDIYLKVGFKTRHYLSTAYKKILAFPVIKLNSELIMKAFKDEFQI